MPTPDRKLLRQLSEIDEFSLAGFSAREGLTGGGVTLLKDRHYFGSWRLTGEQLVWTSANLAEPIYVAETVDDAVRQTLLMILRNLETVRPATASQAKAG